MTTYSHDVEALLGGAAGAAQDRPALEVTPGAGRPSAIVGGAFEGASRFDRSLALWSPGRRSADGDILPVKGMADARTRDMLRNDAYVAGAADLHRDNIVGGIFTLNSKPEYKVLGLDEVWAQEFQDEVETKFSLYAESLENWLDVSRRNTLTELVRLGVGINLAAGEVLASVEWVKDGSRPFGTAIQMIDLDRLSNPDGVMDSPTLRGGVEMNSYGAPIAYHIQVAHPNDVDSWQKYRWRRVAARKPWGRAQMIHIFDQTRPAQTRGIAAMVSGLKELKITKQFRDVILQNAIVNATFAASIESELPSEAAFAALGAGGSGSAIKDFASQYLGAIAEYSGNSRNLLLDGVKIPHLFPGTKLQLRPAGQGGPLGMEFEQSLLRYIAANLGVSYEQLSRDYSQSNYSSIRAAMTETWKYMQSRKRMVADRLATHIYSLWLEEAINMGEITSLPRNVPSFYEGLNKEAYTSCEWIGASRGQVDELKETQAAVLRLQHNITTYEDETARLGKDWRKVMAQREREENEMKRRGLASQNSNMMNAASGAPRKKSATTGEVNA
jgi:lambda family phage portal protein